MPTPSNQDDVFSTPATSRKGLALFSSKGLMSPAETPSPQRFQNISTDESDLGTKILDSLQGLYVPLPDEAISAVKGICQTFTLKMQGIAKGRDISRMAIKAKDNKILELQADVAALEAERETNRAVIRHLRREMGPATEKSP